MRCSSTAVNPHRPQTEHNRINMGCLAGSAGLRKRRDYLISAQAYALISSPTAISMMTGVFHFIAVFLDLILAGGKKSCSAAAAPQGKVGEPRDRGLTIGNRSRRWRPSPPRTATGGIRICRDDDPGQKRRTQDRRFAKSEHKTPSSVSSGLIGGLNTGL